MTNSRPLCVPERRDWARCVCIVFAIVACVSAVYWNVTRTYFCSDDDFLEVHRAAFEDAGSPARIFTTPHFGTFKYRPLNRLVTLLTYKAGNGRAWSFRVRNLVGHLVNVVAVYILAVLLGKPMLVAVVAALLFGLHPMANQSVIGAVMTNTAAAGAFFAALICLIAGTRCKRAAGWWTGFGLTATLAVFLYDTYIVIFACACVYVLLFGLWLRRRIPRGAAGAILLSVVFCLGLYAGLRTRYVPSGYASAAATVPSARVMAGNAGMYAAAVLLPIDPVMANQMFGSPLPSDPRFRSGVWRLAMAAEAAMVAVALVGILWVLWRRRLPAESWAGNIFLAAMAALPLLPVLLFTDHPSETYVYSTVACWVLLLTSLAFACASPFGTRGQAVFLAAAGALAIMFGAGTFMRNSRVAACGNTAQAFLASVPLTQLNGDVSLVFADAPGEPAMTRYGFYNFCGLDTVTNRPGVRSRTLRSALQLSGRDMRIAAEVTDADQLEATALRVHALAAFWVHRDGHLTGIPFRKDAGTSGRKAR